MKYRNVLILLVHYFTLMIVKQKTNAARFADIYISWILM